jgi:hypothetical protein
MRWLLVLIWWLVPRSVGNLRCRVGRLPCHGGRIHCWDDDVPRRVDRFPLQVGRLPRYNCLLLPYFNRIKTVKTKFNYGSITARLKSLEQFVATSFTVSVTTLNCPEMKIYKKLLAYGEFGDKTFLGNQITVYLRTKHFFEIESEKRLSVIRP